MGDAMKFEDVDRYFYVDHHTGDVFFKPSVKGKDSKNPIRKEDGNGYYAINYMRVRMKVHRIAWCLYHKKDIPDGMHIDHANRDTKDNTIDNLRLASIHQNQQNRGKNKNNTSGYKGVCLHRKTGTWFGRFLFDGKFRSTKYHKTPEAAHLELCSMRHMMNSEFTNNGE